MINHMEDVAKMFGLNLGEAFRIADDENNNYSKYYRFSKKYGVEASWDNINWYGFNEKLLQLLMLGKVKIKKLPWKPVVYDEYYYPIPSDRDLWESRLWIGDNYDNSRFSRGLICKTKEEAIDMAKKMLAVVKEEQK